MGLTWLSRQSNYLLVLAAALTNGSSQTIYPQFLDEEVRKSMNPAEWWKAAVKSELTRDIVDLLERLFVLPASTGGIERNFSTLGSIVTKQRNRLKVEKFEKLCFIVNHYKINRNESSLNRRGKRNRDFSFTLEDLDFDSD